MFYSEGLLQQRKASAANRYILLASASIHSSSCEIMIQKLACTRSSRDQTSFHPLNVDRSSRRTEFQCRLRACHANHASNAKATSFQ